MSSNYTPPSFGLNPLVVFGSTDRNDPNMDVKFLDSHGSSGGLVYISPQENYKNIKDFQHKSAWELNFKKDFPNLYKKYYNWEPELYKSALRFNFRSGEELLPRLYTWVKGNPGMADPIVFTECRPNLRAAQKLWSENKQICSGRFFEFCDATYGGPYFNKTVFDDNLKIIGVNSMESIAMNNVLQKIFNTYLERGDEVFDDPNFLVDSQSKYLPEALAKKYDQAWNNYCNKPGNSRKEKCACIPAYKELTDLGFGDQGPHCLNATCASGINTYQPYSTVRTKREIPCRNICSQIIKADAGNINIIKNINLVQTCFNSDEKGVVESLHKKLDNDIGSLLNSYEKASIYVGSKTEGPEEMLFIRSQVSQIDSQVLKELITETRTIVISAKSMLDEYHSIDWSIEGSQEKYTDLKNKIQGLLSGLPDLISSIEKIIYDFVKGKQQIYEEALARKIENNSEYNTTIELMKNYNNLSITELNNYLDKIKGMNTQDTDSPYQISEIITAINGLMSKLSIIPRDTDQSYINEWNNIKASGGKYSVFTGFRIKLQAYLSSKEKGIDSKILPGEKSTFPILIIILAILGIGVFIFIIYYFLIRKTENMITKDNKRGGHCEED